MLTPRHLMRAKRWVQNPPSARRVKFVFGAVALALLVVGLEHFGFWPEWAKAERIKRPL
ncbi:hypothetical protein ABMC88_12440 [Sulfitobacter sp. HNIBRBA2951]|uniref:hypothetical protein n=1 Tax=Sulfitobacter aquimarinus TaxID=3158557 RepID=UPI0032DED4DE